MTHRARRAVQGLVLVCVILGSGQTVGAQVIPDIDPFLHPGFPSGLVSATTTDRVAWIANERGRRNVYTASAPGFAPVRLTAFDEDDGLELSNLSISRDGSTVVFTRGSAPNRDGWTANAASHPDGAERAIWSARTDGSGAWRVTEAGPPAVSPDGRWALFVRDGQIHRVPTPRGAATSPAGSARDRGDEPLLRVWGRNGSPVWSPDGSKFAFVSSRGDHSFIGVFDVESRQLMYMAPSVDQDGSPTWSPNGRRIAFVRRPGTPFGQQTHAGDNSLGNSPGPLWATQQARALAAGRGGAATVPAPPVADIPGMARAAFTGGYTVSFMVADVATGEAREFWRNERDDAVFPTIAAIEWAGDHVIFRHEPEEWIRYYSVAVDAREVRRPVELTPGAGMVETIGMSADGRTLYYATNAGDIDRRNIWSVPTSGGTAVQLSTGPGIEMFPAPLASGSAVAVLASGARQPLSVALLPARGGTPQVVFPQLASEFPATAHVEPQAVTLRAEDDFEFYNQLFLPPDIQPGERRPAIVFVHGGPPRQMLLGYHYSEFYHIAYAVNQWLASQGYVVLSVNFRLGIGYGRSFRTAPNTGARGNAEYRDVLAAGRWLQSRDDVDPKRVGIWGLSYGGVLTAQALARNSDVFAAGADLAGVHLWGSSLDPEDLSFQSSPISAMSTWRSPVLLWHGDDDRNVQFSQTTGLVQLLRAHDVHHEVIVYPDDTHATMLYRRWLDTFHRVGDFMHRFLRAPGAQ